ANVYLLVVLSLSLQMIACSSNKANTQRGQTGKPQSVTLRAKAKGLQEITNSLAFSSDGNMLAVGSGGMVGESAPMSDFYGKIELWDVRTGSRIRTLKDTADKSFDATSGIFRGSMVLCLAFSPDSTFIASGGAADNIAVKLWQTDTGELRQTLKGHSAS